MFARSELRKHIFALFAFVRVADDFADEPIYEGVRKQKLDEWEARLHAAYRGEFEGPIFAALSETVRRLKDAGAVILAHNHPSGVAEPSRADEYLTQSLKSALALVDVRVLDHLVVGCGQVVSFAERGLL